MSSPAWYPVIASSVVKSKPVSAELQGTALVLWRTDDGIAALNDICPHRGAPLSKGCVENAAIACPYHGWRFDKAGKCVAMPALPNTPPRIQAQAYRAVEDGGLIFVDLGSSGEIYSPPPPQQDTPSATRLDVITMNASLVNLAENILDTTHTSVVHSGYLRHHSRQQLVQPKVRCGADWVEVVYPETASPSGFVSKLFGAQRYEITDRFRAPGIAEVEYRHDGKIEFASRFFLTPLAANKTRVFSVLSIRGQSLISELKVSVVQAMLRRVVAEDHAILAQVTANAEKFGQEPSISAPQDFLRRGIEAIMQGREPTQPKSIPEIYI